MLPKQWFRHGDHPAVYPYPDIVENLKHGKSLARMGGLTLCPECSVHLKFHGLLKYIEGYHLVCPYDWIIPAGDTYYACRPDIYDMLMTIEAHKDDKPHLIDRLITWYRKGQCRKNLQHYQTTVSLTKDRTALQSTCGYCYKHIVKDAKGNWFLD